MPFCQRTFHCPVSDEEVSKNFFDKIFQLPFRVPVEEYDLADMILKTFSESNPYCKGIYKILKDNSSVVSSLGEILKNNPRSVKRLYNYYMLYALAEDDAMCGGTASLIDKDKKDKTDSSIDKGKKDILKLLTMAVEISDDTASKKIRDAQKENSLDVFMELIETADEPNPTLKSFSQAYNTLYGKNTEQNVPDEQKSFNDLESVISQTPNLTGSQERKPPQRVTKISIRFPKPEREITETLSRATAAEAVRLTFEKILNEYPKEAEKFAIDFNKRIVCRDPKYKESIFRSKHPITVKNGGVDGKELTMYIGTSTGFYGKAKQVATLCKEMGLGLNSVYWYDGDTIVYPPSI